MRLRLVAAALAAALAAPPPAAFVRTADKTTRRELFWPVPLVPWYLNRDWPDTNTSPSCRPSGGVDPTFAAVRASFAAWQQSCDGGGANLRLLEGGTTNEFQIGIGGTADNIVVFRRGWCSQNAGAVADPCYDDPGVPCSGIYNCFDDPCGKNASSCAGWNVVALTSVLYEPETGRIIDADIEMNGWDGRDDGAVLPPAPRNGWYFTCSDVPTRCDTYGEAACTYMDVQNTLTHEVGHFVGLAHTPDHADLDPQDTWPTMERTTSPGDFWMRTLSPDDVAGVCAIYAEPDGGGCGCGSGGAGGALALAVAALALRRRRIK